MISPSRQLRTLSRGLFQQRAGQPQRFLTAFSLGFTILLWAASFPAIKVALVAYTPAEVAFVRYFVASISLAAYAFVIKMPLPKLRDLPLISVCGFIGFTVYTWALNAGEMGVSAGTASFIIISEIGVIALFAQLFYGERLSRAAWFGVLLCLVGVAVIAFGTGDSFGFSWGAALVFVATLAFSVYTLIQKPLLKRYTATQLTSYAIWTGTLFLFFLAPDSLAAVLQASLSSTLAVAFLGIFPGALAYIAWSYALSRIPAGKAGSYLAIIPIAAMIISWVWLGELPALITLLGSCVILTGVVLINRESAAL